MEEREEREDEVPNKEDRELLRLVAATPGWRVVRNKHIKIYRGDRLVVVTTGTRARGRSTENFRADLRRAGWVDPRDQRRGRKARG